MVDSDVFTWPRVCDYENTEILHENNKVLSMSRK